MTGARGSCPIGGNPGSNAGGNRVIRQGMLNPGKVIDMEDAE